MTLHTVSNTTRETVYIKQVIKTRKFVETDMALPVAFGKTIENEVFMMDLAKMPHLLVAGATGSGKSVGINTIITCLLYKCHPDNLKFVMIDPKKIELSLYRNIQNHFLAMLPDSDEPKKPAPPALSKKPPPPTVAKKPKQMLTLS